MSRNKYKNNTPLNKKLTDLPPPEDGMEIKRGSAEAEPPAEPARLSAWEDPKLQELSNEEYANEELSNKKYANVELADEIVKAEPQVLPGQMDPVPEKSGSEEGAGESLPLADTQQELSVSSQTASAQQDSGGIYETRGIPESAADAAKPVKGDAPIQKREAQGFPWWWILLPLILLALIYGLTRAATPPVDPPATTTPGVTTSWQEGGQVSGKMLTLP